MLLGRKIFVCRFTDYVVSFFQRFVKADFLANAFLSFKVLFFDERIQMGIDPTVITKKVELLQIVMSRPGANAEASLVKSEPDQLVKISIILPSDTQNYFRILSLNKRTKNNINLE